MNGKWCDNTKLKIREGIEKAQDIFFNSRLKNEMIRTIQSVRDEYAKLRPSNDKQRDLIANNKKLFRTFEYRRSRLDVESAILLIALMKMASRYSGDKICAEVVKILDDAHGIKSAPQERIPTPENPTPKFLRDDLSFDYSNWESFDPMRSASPALTPIWSVSTLANKCMQEITNINNMALNEGSRLKFAYDQLSEEDKEIYRKELVAHFTLHNFEFKRETDIDSLLLLKGTEISLASYGWDFWSLIRNIN